MSTELLRTDNGPEIIEVANAAGSHPQEALIAFIVGKLERLRSELAEVEANVAEFLEKKWKAAPMKAIARRLQKQVEYYEKVKAALEAGYVVMPPISCEVFAVRISENAMLPGADVNNKKWAPRRIGASTNDVETDSPPLGDGEYVGPRAICLRTYFERGNPPEQMVRDTPEYTDDVAFPLIMAKPRIIEATDAAMAENIFDDIAISPSRTGRKKDPIIVGRIHRPQRFSEPSYFLIAWLVRAEEI